MQIKHITLACTLALVSTGSYAESQASDIEFHFGGSIKTVLLYDTDVAGVGINIPGSALLAFPSENSDTKIDASLSQVRFGTSQTLAGGSSLRSQVVMDFNENNDGGMSPRLREAYVAWSMEQGQLLAGHTWSTFMDLRNIPQSVAEATVSGAVFKRQPLVRWTQNAGAFKYDVALESSTNDDINLLGTDLDNSGSSPAIALAAEWVNQDAWVRATSLFNELRVTNDGNTHRKWGYGVQLSAGWDFTDKDRITILGNIGEGTDRYLLGLAGVGATWNESSQDLDLRATDSLVTTYTRKWQDDLKSVFAYGTVSSEPLENQREINAVTLTSTEYAMANLLWAVKPNLTIGAEYSYSQYKLFSGDERDNHRIMLGMDWQY
ncbi:DcaP family trimeric outer membrane transporter [Photobacterium rosenbergii]|uniref:DcaP family trimeric outer membrane transporter n=1 Tax=Photobacterium rosenbergii TaxID=294936 RepID=A0ABU3ZHY5_9GAMM|nr:DcaP family trimeric outer membrane transporter [Photobacterium rosenbergii]MDV5169647.1 DcaP family trimeric outer membrane transporter [Photobacterium rosenbergii]